MPNLNLDQNIFEAGASASAGDWFNAAVNASLDFRGGVQFRRGVNLQAQIGIMGELDAAFRYFLAADAQVRAQARAALQGQIQSPLDLFDEAGMAVRLQAVAEASASIRLALGLSIRDFLELAQQDPRIDGIAYQLLEIFLEELDVQAGVLGKAAFSAMAYANIVLAGRLVRDEGRNLDPGFTISAEMGCGLEGGVGYQLFANLGFKDTRRLASRTVDVLVDEAAAQVAARLDDDYARTLVVELRPAGKMALRCAFELAHALYEKAPTFADSGPELARQCVRVVLEEAQKALLEMLVRHATQLFLEALDSLGISEGEWDASEPQRQALANLLRTLPAEPFTFESETLTYWADLANAAVGLALELAGSAAGDDEVDSLVEPVAVIWSATQLAISGTKQVLDAGARVSFLGAVSASASARAFEGALPGAPPPTLLRNHINGALGRSAATPIRQDDLVEYLVRDVLLDGMVKALPEARVLLDIFAGAGAGGAVATAKVVMRNIGAFVPAADGSGVDPEASLRVVVEGLEAYIDARVEAELRPTLQEALPGDPIVQLYLDEVVLASMDFAVHTVLQRVLAWSAGDVLGRDALREACSSIVMKLLGRSAVVTADVLIAEAQAQVSEHLLEAAEDVRDPGGPAESLAQALSADEELVGEVLEETLKIGAVTFGPFTHQDRARIRGLLYELLDTVPSPPDAGWVEQLQQDFMVPSPQSQEALMELAGVLGERIQEMVMRFLDEVLTRLGEIALEELEEFMDGVQAQVAAWIDDLTALAADLLQRLLALPEAIAALADEVAALAEEALADARAVLELPNSPAGKALLLDVARERFVDAALGPLESSPVYHAVPANRRAAVRSRLKTTVKALVKDDVVNPLLSALAPLSSLGADVVGEMEELVQDLRDVDPGANVTAQVGGILLDRIEEAMLGVWGAGDLAIEVAFSFTYQPPKVFGWKPPKATASFDLGDIEVPVDELTAAVREAIAGAALFEDLVEDLAGKLVAMLLKDDERAAAEIELALVESEYPRISGLLQDSAAAKVDVVVLSPAPASLHEGPFQVDVLLPGVPMSWLEEDDLTPARVFVLLNDEAVALEEWEVTMEEGGPGSANEGTTTGFLLAARRLQRPGGVVSRQRGGGSAPQPERSGPHGGPKGFAARGEELTRRQKMSTVSHVQRGPRLRRVLDPGNLRTGINTLSVIVLNGRSTRVARTVSFLVPEPDGDAAPARVVRIARPLWTWDHLSPELADHVVKVSRDGAGGSRRDGREGHERPPGEGRERPPRGAPRREERPYWWTTKRRERERARTSLLGRIEEQAGRRRERFDALRTVVREGALRPRPRVAPSTPESRPEEPRPDGSGQRKAKPDSQAEPSI